MNASAKTEQTEKKGIVERKKRDELREIIRQCEKDKEGRKRVMFFAAFRGEGRKEGWMEGNKEGMKKRKGEV